MLYYAVFLILFRILEIVSICIPKLCSGGFRDTMTKRPVQNKTAQKDAEHQDATGIQDRNFVCFQDY